MILLLLLFMMGFDEKKWLMVLNFVLIWIKLVGFIFFIDFLFIFLFLVKFFRILWFVEVIVVNLFIELRLGFFFDKYEII